MTDKQTLQIYASRAADYADTVRKTAIDPDLERFIEALPPGGTALDIGCGPGFAAQAMAARGLKVEAWDPVPEMLKLAAAHPDVNVRQAGFDDLNVVDAFDGIWANFSMLHTPLDRWPDQFARIAIALKPGGLFHIGTKTGHGQSRDKIGRLYTYVTEQELRAMLRTAGFAEQCAKTGEGTGLSGEVARFIVIQSRTLDSTPNRR